MILIVDDEASQLEFVGKTLGDDGHRVISFTRAAEALERAAEDEPELVLSDIMMPGMGGLDFKDAYQKRFPHRLTPFVFFTSLSEPGDIVRGLETGADDYLVKPVAPEVLRAKVRSLLRRKERYATPVFQGDLGRYPFIKVLQFCELHGLTGHVEFAGPDLAASVPFRSGSLALEPGDDRLTSLYDLTEGRFTIHSRPIDFRALEEVALPADSTPPDPVDRPMGKLSAVRANQRLFQIQTELASHPERQILSVAILDGNTVLKRKSPPPAGANRQLLEKLIEEQHHALETEVREKLIGLVRDKGPTPKELFYQRFETGFEEYRKGNLEAALAAWEEAKALNPSDKAIEINLRVVRGKLEGRSGR